MSVRTMRLDSRCPACGVLGLEYSAIDLELPYFGKILQLVFMCGDCGFRHSDFLIGSTHEPTRWVQHVKGVDDLDARVVRSTSGTVRVPELGVLIEPGPASDAYVSNIEGVLVRVGRVLRQLLQDAETPEQKQACEERLQMLNDAQQGRSPFTFILEDPYGNSAVIHDNAVKQMIPPDEAEHLKRGEITLQLQAEAAAGGGNGHHKPDGDGPPA